MTMPLIMKAIFDEAERAHKRFGPPTSTHESLGVLLEEVEELAIAIRENDAESVSREAIQVAAVAYRLALVISDGDTAFHNRSGLDSSVRLPGL